MWQASMAVLQSYFMLHRDSAQRAAELAPDLCAGLREAVPVQQHLGAHDLARAFRGAVVVGFERTAAD